MECNKFLLILQLCLYLSRIVNAQNCNVRNVGPGKAICVCNEEYCDTVPQLQSLESNQYQIYRTSIQNMGFNTEVNDKGSKNNSTNTIIINRSKKYQTIIGFGGAFTDSAGINILSLPNKTRDHLMESYFGKDGVEYSFCRIPIGGTDFSTRAYSYDDNPGDVTLEKFELQPEDLNYKIPFIKQALNLRQQNIKFLASAWSPPAWMKTNDKFYGFGMLLEDYYCLWAEYHLKFIEKYNNSGVPIWAITTGNEPIDGIVPFYPPKLNSLGWTPSTQKKWINSCLGPKIRNSEFSDTKIFLHDDNRLTLPLLPLLLSDNTTLSYIDGVAVHWYTDPFIPAVFLKFAESPNKNLLLIGSEASNGAFPFEPSMDLGSMDRGFKYVNDILEDLEYGAAGWIDWNIALNMEGGPTYINNNVDSPILVNATSGEFYKQPMFYVMGHFSKFVVSGSIRINHQVKVEDTGIKTDAFVRPDDLISVIIVNENNEEAIVNIQEGTQIFTVTLEAKSINTVLFK